MLSIQILTVGDLKEAYLKAACSEYQKRLSPICKLTVTEIAEAHLSKQPSPTEILRGLEIEGGAILQKISPRAFVVALCIEGSQISSEGLADKLADISQSHSEIVWIIGGSHGLSSQVKQRADLRLSFSAMTFPHQLARVLLLEQLYRAFSINNGSKYHK